MTENTNELSKSISSTMADLESLKDKATDSQKKRELDDAIDLLRNELIKAYAVQLENHPYEKSITEMRETTRKLKALQKDLQKEIDKIEDFVQIPGRIKKLIERIGNVLGIPLSL